jgi:hypothetical protein
MLRKRRITRKVLEQFNYQCISCGTVVLKGADLTEFESRHGRLSTLLLKDNAYCQACVDRMTVEGPDLRGAVTAMIEWMYAPPPPDPNLHDPLTCEVCVYTRQVDRAVYDRDPDHCHVCQRSARYNTEIVWRKDIHKHTFENFKLENLLAACDDCIAQRGLNRARPRIPESSHVLLKKSGVIYVEFRKKPQRLLPGPRPPDHD